MKNLLCVPINGMAGSGKDTFAAMAAEHVESIGADIVVHNVSSVDRVKQAARLLGWHGDKDNKSRQFLSDIKDLATAYSNSPFKYMTGHVERANRAIVFLHIREPEEITAIVEWCKTHMIHCQTLKISRTSVDIVDNNTGDVGSTLPYDYDIQVNNNLALAELRLAAEEVVNTWIEKYKLT